MNVLMRLIWNLFRTNFSFGRFFVGAPGALECLSKPEKYKDEA